MRSGAVCAVLCSVCARCVVQRVQGCRARIFWARIFAGVHLCWPASFHSRPACFAGLPLLYWLCTGLPLFWACIFSSCILCLPLFARCLFSACLFRVHPACLLCGCTVWLYCSVLFTLPALLSLTLSLSLSVSQSLTLYLYLSLSLSQSISISLSHSLSLLHLLYLLVYSLVYSLVLSSTRLYSLVYSLSLSLRCLHLFAL